MWSTIKTGKTIVLDNTIVVDISRFSRTSSTIERERSKRPKSKPKLLRLGTSLFCGGLMKLVVEHDVQDEEI